MRAWRLWVVLACALGSPALGVTVENVPRLGKGSWMVDTTGTMTAELKSEVDTLGNALDGRGLGQVAAVVVDSTSGRPSRAFALELFNRWGLGHRGRNDGALLFVALKDRKVEIILGEGVDEPRDQQASDRLMATAIVPAFKRGSPQAAVRDGVLGLHRLIEQSELNNPHGLPPSETPVASPVPVADTGPTASEESFERQEPSSLSSEARFFATGFGVFGGLGGLVMGGLALRRRMPRKCRKCATERKRLDEATDDAHLDPGQRHEEAVGSVDYDVWWCEPCEDALVERYSVFFTRHARCGKCNYVTANKTTKTLRAATYDHGGEVEVTLTCGHCAHVSTSRHRTPRRTRSTSSSSSSGSRSSSSGGGRSSGGGSSGSW